MSRIAVIGGGPGGMMAAVAAVDKGHQVDLFDSNEKLGKKMYITGKGRCNLTNAVDICDYFDSIVDTAFTAQMENELDSVEAGDKQWREVLKEFYPDFEKKLERAENDIEKIVIEDEKSDVICDKCGATMVYKNGRFGRFLACPGYPECSFTKPLVIEMPGKCPKCGKPVEVAKPTSAEATKPAPASDKPPTA